MGNCKFCLQEKMLIEAHVIPKWAFKYLYPDDPELKKQPITLIHKKGQTKRPIGPYDSEILCSYCDNILGNYDNYGKTVLLDSQLNEKSELAYVINSVDIKKLRLFFLSMIWRGSISDREEFNSIFIGPYEEKIRTLLMDAVNGIVDDSLNEFNFIVTKFDIGKLPKDIVEKK